MAVNPVCAGIGQTPLDEEHVDPSSGQVSDESAASIDCRLQDFQKLTARQNPFGMSAALRYASQKQTAEEDPFAEAIESMNAPQVRTPQEEDPFADAIEDLRREQTPPPQAPSEDPFAAAIAELTEERIDGWKDRVSELKRANSENRVRRMDRETATTKLQEVMAFLQEVPDMPDTSRIRRDAETLQTRLRKRIFDTFKSDLRRYPEDARHAREITDLETIAQYRAGIAAMRAETAYSLLDSDLQRKLNGLMAEREGVLQERERYILDHINQTQQPVEPVAPPPPPPPAPEAPQPSARLVRQLGELENDNTAEKIDSMTRGTATQHLTSVISYIGRLGDDPVNGELKSRAETLRDALRFKIFILLQEEISTIHQAIQTVTEQRDINSYSRKINDLKDAVGDLQLDDGQLESLRLTLSQAEGLLQARQTALQQEAALRRVQEGARDAIETANDAVEDFRRKAADARTKEQELRGAATQCTGRREFRRVSEAATDAIEAATDAKRKADEAIERAFQAVAALPPASRGGLAIPSLPEGEEGRIPDANSLPTSQPFHASQPVVSGRTMTVTCDCNGEIADSEQIPATKDAIQEKLAAALNGSDFPPALLGEFDIRVDALGYVTEVVIRVANNQRLPATGQRVSGEEFLEDGGMSRWYFRIANTILKRIRLVNGSDGRRVRSIPLALIGASTVTMGASTVED